MTREDLLVGTPRQPVDVASSATPDAYQTRTASTDAYGDLITPSRDCSAMFIFETSGNGCILSLDEGTTDHIVIPAVSGGVGVTLHGMSIVEAQKIQSKNLSAGNHHTVYITIW